MDQQTALPDLHLKINAVPKDFYKKYLKLFIAATGKKVTPTELKIIEKSFMDHEGAFDTDARKAIREEFKMSVTNVNNYVMKLRKQGLVNDENVLVKLLNPRWLKLQEETTGTSAKIIFTIVPKAV